MKIVKLSLVLASLCLFGCSSQVDPDEHDLVAGPENVDESSEGVEAEPKYYHFIRFNIADEDEYGTFLRQLKRLAGANSGRILTAGRPLDCLEKTCYQSNVVLEFSTQANADNFFAAYQSRLTAQAALAATDLNYCFRGELTSPLFNESISAGAYFIGASTLVDPVAFSTNYAPVALQTINARGGNILTGATVSPVCPIGSDPLSTVLIRFTSLSAARDWYNSPEYQSVVPVRQASTVGGAVLLAAACEE